MWKMTRRARKGGVRNAGGLSVAELLVLAAFPTGSRVELAAGNADDDPARGGLGSSGGNQGKCCVISAHALSARGSLLWGRSPQ
jgi:hypothetical protein